MEAKPAKVKKRTYHYPDGLVDFVKHINKTKTPIHNSVVGFTGKGEGHEVEIAMQWNAGYSESVPHLANTINTHEGGTHEEGFRTALTATVNKYAKERSSSRRRTAISPATTFAKVSQPSSPFASVSPQFEGQTKTKLGNTEVRSFVLKACNEHLSHWFESNPADAKTIINKAVSSAQARMAARKARELVRRKSAPRSAAYLASWRIAAPTTRRSPRSTSWRVTPQAARPNRVATRCSRRSFLSRKDHQRREGTHRPRPQEQRGPVDHHCLRHGYPRRVRHHQTALSQDRPDGRRRRRRQHFSTLLMTLLFRFMRR